MVGEARSAQEVLKQCRELRPDILIMDTFMPELEGLECLKIIKSEYPEIRILALTSFHDQEHMRQCILAGLSGYILKRSMSDELKLAILAVSRGGVYIDSAVSQSFREIVDCKAQSRVPLSERELQVLSLMAQGLLLKEISNQLHVSVKTVETYKSRVFEKLNFSSRFDLVKYAMEQGLLETMRISNNEARA